MESKPYLQIFSLLLFMLVVLAVGNLLIEQDRARFDFSQREKSANQQWDARNHPHEETLPEHVSAYLTNCTNRGDVIYCDVDIGR
jgi:hypothetical protein